jgi:hypothetical protein
VLAWVVLLVALRIVCEIDRAAIPPAAQNDDPASLVSAGAGSGIARNVLRAYITGRVDRSCKHVGPRRIQHPSIAPSAPRRS